MDSLSLDQTLLLDTLIYSDYFTEALNKGEKQTIEEIVVYIEKQMTAKQDFEYNAEMSKEEWQEIYDLVKNDEVLCGLTINKSTYENDSTGFRAMLVTDPKEEFNNTVIFRGTASDSQWHDNFAVTQGVALTPQQLLAKRYIAGLGLDKLDISGHSKGGNLSECMAYLLPNGMVNRVISYDGQRQTKEFLAMFSKQQKNVANSKVLTINEVRDIVSKLFLANMDGSKNLYFWSYDKYDLEDIFLYHKPNLYFKSKYGPYVHDFGDWLPKMGYAIDDIMSWDDVDFYSRHGLSIVMPEGWTAVDYKMAKEANRLYLSMTEKRNKKILKALMEKAIWADPLANRDDSEIVSGAVIYCDFGDGIGELKSSFSHGRTTRGKPVLASTDTKPGANIVFENNTCFGGALDVMTEWANAMNNGLEGPYGEDIPPFAIGTPCEPETDDEWLIVDDDKTVSVGGANVSTVLKKSVLCCKKGGIIQIEMNGQ